MASVQKRFKPGMLPINIINVLKNKKIQESFTFVFSPINGYYIKGDCKIDEDEMDELLPLELVRIESKGALIGHRRF